MTRTSDQRDALHDLLTIAAFATAPTVGIGLMLWGRVLQTSALWIPDNSVVYSSSILAAVAAAVENEEGMKVTKWVHFGQEVEINISMHDIREALTEALGSPATSEHEPMKAVFACLAQTTTFYRAITDEQIVLMNDNQRKLIGQFLSEQADRFRVPTPGAVYGGYVDNK